jgi:lipoprotein NlpD
MSYQYFLSCVIAAIFLSACSNTALTGNVPKPKPVSTGTTRTQAAGEQDWRPATHQVLKGDTLYSIAFYYGLDYHDIATLNNISNPSVISIGQILQLFSVTTSSGKSGAEPVIKEQPKLVKYEYSVTALAKIDNVQAEKLSTPAPLVSNAPKPSKPNLNILPSASAVAATTAVAKIEPRVDAPVINTDADTLQWTLPTSGKIITLFSEAQNRKGIDITGKLGQPIFASAPGKVVYSGSGLRGYGKLIIIKHNATYLSAYAHNDKILVKEGQIIKRAEKIAEMGSTDAHQVKLHFEVRRLGKPVDPTKYLPKS